MNKKFFTDIKSIRNAIDTNKLVIFAGAGISIDAGIPGWGSLIDEMKSEIEIPHNEQDYLRIAQMYFNDRQQKEYIEKVRTVLKHKKAKHNEIHEEIFELNPVHILTTNYDDLLEQVIKKRSLPVSVVTKDKEFPYALNTNLLVKVHGDLDETDIVLKEDDYIDYSINHPLIEAFLKSVFASKVVLFIGYGFSDINLKMIIQSVRNILGKDFQSAYLLSIEKNLHPTQREYLKSKGVNVINYFDAEYETAKNFITDYLNGNNALNEVYLKKGDNLSEKGQVLLNFLRFISTYDKFNETLTEKNVVDQIHLSLSRFSELQSLPPDFIANLFPFNNSKRYVNNYEGYSLLTRNHTLYDLFFNQLEYVNDEVKYKPTSDMNLSTWEIAEVEAKLKDIIRILNNSLIFHIFKENAKPDSFGHHGWSDTSQKLQIKETSLCNCINCRLSRLEFNSILKEVLTSTVNETTSIQSDLSLAYANYKIGNFHQSVRLFEETANKAWQSGKYFSYYISKHNIKTIRNLFQWYERSLPEEEKTRILKELEDIDFDKQLFQIPYMGKSEYELLKTIRDDGVLHRAENKISNTHKEILRIYDLYKEGGRSFGPYYPELIEIELLKIITFYTNNYIIADEFTNFQRVCNKGVEALLISYATDEAYSEKLKEFTKLFFDVIVFYCDAKEIQKITEKYKINNLTFTQKSLVEIILVVNNFLKSFFEKIDFQWQNTHIDSLTANQLGNDFFKDKCKAKFNNIFVLLSGVELKADLSTILIENISFFLRHESFLSYSDMDSLCSFIYKNSALFSREVCIELLNTASKKIGTYTHNSFFRTMAFVFTEHKYLSISDRELIMRIHTITNLHDPSSKDIVYLWAISDDSIKEELKKLILDTLDTKFESDLYTLAAIKGIIDYNSHFSQYIHEINSAKGTGDYELIDGKPKLRSFVFLNAVLFMYQIGIKSNDERLKGFSNLAEYMKFFLSPEEYDYSNFKKEWLYFINLNPAFYERTAKIASIKLNLEELLKEEFNAELAENYAKYFLK